MSAGGGATGGPEGGTGGPDITAAELEPEPEPELRSRAERGATGILTPIIQQAPLQRQCEIGASSSS
jgi:hypothetical protein